MKNAFISFKQQGSSGIVFSKGPSELLGVQLPVNSPKLVARIAMSDELRIKVVSTVGNLRSALLNSAMEYKG